MKIHRFTKTACWFCGRHLDAARLASQDADSAPRQGDISLCGYCGALSLFDPPGLRAPTEGEVAAIRSDPKWPTLVRIAMKPIRFPSNEKKEAPCPNPLKPKSLT